MNSNSNTNTEMQFDKDTNSYIIICPHCKENIIVNKNEINCTIFRHGVIKSNNQQMNPHTPKTECDRLFNENLIYGCGKPFKFNGTTLSKCDYI